MRTLLSCLVLTLLCGGLKAQQGSEAARDALLKDPVSAGRAVFPVRTKVSRATLLDPAKLKRFIHQEEAQHGRAKASGQGAGRKTGAVKQTLGAGCTNKGFFVTVGMTNSAIYVSCIGHTQDDGVLIAGELYDSTILDGQWITNAFLVKSDNNGNILWTTLFVDQQYTQWYYINPAFVKEMPDGDLVMAAYQDDMPNDDDEPVTLLYHLSPTGTILWQSELKCTLTNKWQPNGWPYFQVKDINPGQNGDYILAGTTVLLGAGAQGMTVARLDANGKPIWDANLTNETGDANLGAEGMNAFWTGNTVVAIGVSHGSSTAFPVATIFATLDYATGVWQTRRYWDNVYSNANTEWVKDLAYYSNRAVHLNNGHYLVYGDLIGIFWSGQDTTHYFGVQEFDASFGFVRAYTIDAMETSVWENNSIYFDNSNNGFVTVPMQMSSTDNVDDNLYFAHMQNGQIARERVSTFSGGARSGWYIQSVFMNDGAYYLADDYFDVTKGVFFAMKKMYDTDTASVCLGRDTTFFFTEPFDMKEDPGYYYVDPPVYNQIVQVSHPTGPAPITYRESSPCLVGSSCSLLQIMGQTAACGVAQPLVYKAHRNWECGAMPLWSIDTTVSKVTQLNDSMVSIQFKNVNWHGKLYADILPGSCSVGQADSVELNIVATPQAPSLTPNLLLCAGNTLELHAGPIYSSYLWQDGSTDSNYLVTQPGDYEVAVTDACGNNYHAATDVVLATFSFSLGPDITKCNNDTVTLKATGGFYNYQWTSTDVNQTGMSDSVVRVDPSADENYVVTAEKFQGCSVTSSVLVGVLHSPAIRLGDDTSFCSGGSVLLDAGGGFASYLWNTGQSSQQITASQAGTYSVAAAAANGCSSYDTMKIDAVYPLPQEVLGSGSDTAICSNEPLVYSFPANGDVYTWSDGSGSSSRTIDLPGSYGLTVVNGYGCSVSRSIMVSVKPAPVVDLGDDTTLCAGKTLVLDAAGGTVGGQYTWQDGSTGPDYTVGTGGLYVALASLNGCTSSDSIRVSFIGAPKFGLGKDTSICEGDAFILHPSLSYPGNFLWQDGSTQNNYLVNAPGDYSLEASNQCGSSTGTIHVLTGLCRLVMPNAFTPNQDGRNDVFRVKYPFPVSRFSMTIYDRWGQQVYATHSISEGWDGTIGGAPAPAGTYVWYITLTDIQQKTESGKGVLLLIR